MESIYVAQDAFRQTVGLSKVPAVRNENCRSHGTKSYVYLLNRFGFDPTKPGPYFHMTKPQEQGIIPKVISKVIGRHRENRVLVKRIGDPNSSQTTEVTAEDMQNDLMYICEVEIGTPAQKVRLDFDTGSADLWVDSTSESKKLQTGHKVFDPTKSRTWENLKGKEWKIQYGDGSTASGTCGSDNLKIGGLTIKKQCIEIAESLSTQFVKSASDGLLGLAFSTINTVTTDGVSDPQSTPVENMIKQDDIPKSAELFTSCFYGSRDSGAPESFYTFGYIDQELVKKSGKDISWVKIDNSEGFWQFKSPKCSVNGKTITSTGNTAIADTGTTLALMSDEVCEALYDQIPGAKYDYWNQGYIFPIDTKLDDLPEFKVAIGDKMFVIQKEDIAFAQPDESHWYGGIQSRGSLTFDILGDTFLKSVYAIWDQGNTRFGLVPKIEKEQNLTPPHDSGSGGITKLLV